MKKRFLTLSLLSILISGSIFSQVLTPVQWTFYLEESETKEIELVFEASIDETWHLYSLDIPAGGPIPTSFVFVESDNYERTGEVIEVTEAHKVYDSSFDMEVGMFSDKAVFKQKITVLSQDNFRIEGYVEFMSCDDERCLPPAEEEFSFSINANEKADTEEVITKGADTGSKSLQSGLLGFFLFAMLMGFVGILTPCVFPMIPMTVAFFSQGTENKTKAILKAFVFGFSIMFIYTAIGLIVSLTSAGADFANNLSTHWIPNLIFFTLFMVFAASFLGLFEMVLPSSIVNKADQQADKGGYLAAFFMGLTTVLVSFSCTGPIVGALLVEAASGDIIRPTIGMFG
ncbi:MAG: cytochrome c biogenesis protein CcdA, partial [Bacteroidota bacterium]|nr:cytochrome c biogenesis protein CcdA [Bacteroidota bacterium]